MYKNQVIVRMKWIFFQITQLKERIIYVLFCGILLFMASCISNVKNQEANDATNDSIINAQLRTLVDSTLLCSELNLKVDQLEISTSYTDNDTIKNVTGKGTTNRYNRYGNEEFDITGNYRVSNNMLNCKLLKVTHRHVGNVFEMYDTITKQVDSLTFSQHIDEYYKRQDELWKERKDLTENAYANRTKVHFGISREEYNRLGEDFQRNFFEGLVGNGAYELAKPIYSKENIFVGFEIWEIHGQTFYYYNVEDNAELVRHNRSGYDGHGLIRLCYFCRLYNMEIIISYDQLNNRNKHLTAYWNDHVRIFDRN